MAAAGFAARACWGLVMVAAGSGTAAGCFDASGWTMERRAGGGGCGVGTGSGE